MHYLLKILEDEGCVITPKSRILDFGCGAGSLVHSLREKGYDAFGCDISFKEGPYTDDLQRQGYIRTISSPEYRLPYDDGYFDYIVSETVFEHVQNTDETIREIARILKPGGLTLHCFPSRYCPIENHVRVPLASMITAYPWLLFWALLGIRNRRQKGLPAVEVARMNKSYLENCTKYLSPYGIRKAFNLYFSSVRFVEKSAIRNSPTRLTVMLGKKLAFLPFLPFLYRIFKAHAVLAIK